MRSLILTVLLLGITGIMTCLFSCSDSHTRTQLDTAESLVDSDPDSALRILRKIEHPRRKQESVEARYNMLLTEARYKADSLPLDDSIVRVSADYYERKKDSSNAAKAHYLAGICDYTNKRYPNALVSFFKADKYASRSSDTMLIALIKRSIGDSYNEFYDVKTALKYHKESYRLFKKANATLHADFQLITIASAYIDLGEYKNALKYAESALKQSIESNDSNMLFLSQELKATAYLRLNEIEKAASIYTNLPKSNPNFSEYNYMRLGEIYLSLGNTEAAMECNRHITTIEPGVNAITINQLIIEKRYDEALNLMMKTYEIIDSVTKSVWTRNDISFINDYFKNEEKKSIASINAEKRKNSGFAIISVLIILLVAAGYFIRVIYLKKKILGNLLEAENLKNEVNDQKKLNMTFQTDLKKNRELIADLEKGICELTDRNISISRNLEDAESRVTETRQKLEKMKEHASGLIVSRFSILDDLLSEYYTCKDTKTEKDRLYNKVKETIDSYINGNKMTEEIEETMNANLDNIISRFKSDFPNLGISNIHLYMFLALNFSTSAICVLQDTTPDTLYSRKSKLKSRIRNIGSDSELYLRYL
ncbi:MAG: hypothetical protein K2L59_05445 [Muribaculaceae bacterium]|nr:hypothetical protein [Muribaculaceae bacterium]